MGNECPKGKQQFFTLSKSRESVYTARNKSLCVLFSSGGYVELSTQLVGLTSILEACLIGVGMFCKGRGRGVGFWVLSPDYPISVKCWPQTVHPAIN